MAPPPVTPTPRRFLVPKRSASQQPRNETPKPLPNVGVSGQQFHATPRFSFHSTPRDLGTGPSSSLTPAAPPPQSLFRSSRNTETIHDAIESSQELPEQPSYFGQGRFDNEEIYSSQHLAEAHADVIRESSPIDSTLPVHPRQISEGEDEGTPRAPRPPSPKRRRISVSPSDELNENPDNNYGGRSPGLPVRFTRDKIGKIREDILSPILSPAEEDDDTYHAEVDMLDVPTLSPTSSNSNYHDDRHRFDLDTTQHEQQGEEEEEERQDYETDDNMHHDDEDDWPADQLTPRKPGHHQHLYNQQEQQQQQPIFHRAPRFKPTSLEQTTTDAVNAAETTGNINQQRWLQQHQQQQQYDPLPEAFSPHKGRRGAKYVPGGLAAELRDWLVNLEAGRSGVGVGLSGSMNREGDDDDDDDNNNDETCSDNVGGIEGISGVEARRSRKRDPWIVRVKVEEVKASPVGMTLVSGLMVGVNHDDYDDDYDGDGGQEDADGGSSNIDGGGGGGGKGEGQKQKQKQKQKKLKLLLAGEGRLTGLGKRKQVHPGDVVGVARPSWDVNVDVAGLGLGDGTWSVACDWDVCSEGGER